MKCPIDQETLVISDRQGIEIDYCPSCRGVWLDRGELDKLIEREADRYEAPAARRPDEPSEHRRRDDDDDRRRSGYDDDERQRSGYGAKRKKKGFLSEMFEFGD